MAFRRSSNSDDSNSSSRDNFGFGLADDTTAPAIVASVCARGGHGKTDFGCSAPGPIYYLSIDPNAKGVIAKWRRKDKEIHYRGFQKPAMKISLKRYGVINADEEAKEAAKTQWEAFIETFTACVRAKVDPKPRTIVVDTGSEFRQLQTVAHFGKTIQIPKNAWTIPNLEYAELIGCAREAQAQGINVIVLHRLTEEWKDTIKKVSENGALVEKEVSEKTGVWVRDGHKKMEYLVDVEVVLTKDTSIELDPDAEEAEVSKRFSMTVLKCTERPALEGRTWVGATKKGTRRTDFPWLAAQVFPDTHIDDWRA